MFISFYVYFSRLYDRFLFELGLDMTTEAALAKLSYLLSLGLSTERVRELMGKNLRGELTAVREKQTFSLKDASFLKRMYSSILASSVGEKEKSSSSRTATSANRDDAHSDTASEDDHGPAKGTLDFKL